MSGFWKTMGDVGLIWFVFFAGGIAMIWIWGIILCLIETLNKIYKLIKNN